MVRNVYWVFGLPFVPARVNWTLSGPITVNSNGSQVLLGIFGIGASVEKIRDVFVRGNKLGVGVWELTVWVNTGNIFCLRYSKLFLTVV